MLGDGRAAFEALTRDGFPECPEYTACVEAMMTIEIFILDGDSGLFEIAGKVIEFDGGTVLVVVDIVEEFTMAI